MTFDVEFEVFSFYSQHFHHLWKYLYQNSINFLNKIIQILFNFWHMMYTPKNTTNKPHKLHNSKWTPQTQHIINFFLPSMGGSTKHVHFIPPTKHTQFRSSHGQNSFTFICISFPTILFPYNVQQFTRWNNIL
jgi:hypothetical protein